MEKTPSVKPRVVSRRLRKRRKLSDQWFLKLVRYSGGGNAVAKQPETFSHHCYRLIAPQLCALTLLPNTQLMRFIRVFDDCWGALGDDAPKVRLPKLSAQKEWISHLIRSSGLGDSLVPAKAREKKRQEILADENNLASDHLAMRAYPVRCSIPQNDYKEKNYLLLVAFHLTQGWASLCLTKMQARWQARSVLEFKSVASQMVAPRTRKAFMTQLHDALSPLADGQTRRVILHASEHEESFWKGGHSEGWKVVFDLPKVEFGKDRLVIKCKTRAHLKVGRYQFPELDKSTQSPRRVERLPRLDSLQPKDKDRLIRALWNELKDLRKPGAAN